jgi:protein-ribulosamine 3-kinase
MFEKEILGLKRLENPGGAIVPRVIGHAIADQSQLLVLEWVEPGRAKIDLFWSDFGECLARMHRVTSGSFGLDEDNYMGALPQSNTPSDQWTDFFIRQRLEPQVRLAIGKSLLTPPIVHSFEQLYKRLPAIFPPEPPSLLHGDLWSGNFLRGLGGQAVLIDPAVYYGHRSMDLAMTTLFGGFDRGFYESYDHHYPFPDNYREQWAVCNLYPLLIHLNLFGAGYLGEIVETLKLFN